MSFIRHKPSEIRQASMARYLSSESARDYLSAWGDRNVPGRLGECAWRASLGIYNGFDKLAILLSPAWPGRVAWPGGQTFLGRRIGPA